MTDFQVEDFVSCDIETLGLSVDSSIIQVGLCWYNEGEYKTASALVKPDEARSNKSTLAWWESQTETGNFTLHNAYRSGADTLAEGFGGALSTLMPYSGHRHGALQNMEWWFRGPQFDEAMLSHQSNADSLWKYYNVRCQRTLEKTVLDLGYTMNDILQGYQAEGVKHDAGYDAEMQARSIVGCKKILQSLRQAFFNYSLMDEAHAAQEAALERAGIPT